MADAESVVRAFFDDTAKGDLIGALENHFAENALWSNSGFPDAKGMEACKGLMQGLIDGFGLHSLTPEFRSIVVSGNVVAVERVEALDDAEGNRVVTLPVMGTFEVADGKITALRDYFDPRAFMPEG